MHENDWITMTAERLAELYDQDFGGKANGRYRIPEKIVRRIARRRRLYETEIRALSVALYELGYVLIDLARPWLMRQYIDHPLSWQRISQSNSVKLTILTGRASAFFNIYSLRSMKEK